MTKISAGNGFPLAVRALAFRDQAVSARVAPLGAGDGLRAAVRAFERLSFFRVWQPNWLDGGGRSVLAEQWHGRPDRDGTAFLCIGYWSPAPLADMLIRRGGFAARPARDVAWPCDARPMGEWW